MMYKIDKHDHVVELTNVPQSTTGEPIPILLAGEHNVLLAFYLQKNQKDWDGTSARIVGTASKGDPIAIVNFKRCYAHMFGPPNDEAFEGHPLAKRGLMPYSAFEVKDSSWLRTLEKMNSVHSHHNKERFMENKKHFIFTFHDTTFECIAEEFQIELTNGSVKGMVPKMMESIR